VEIYSVQFSLNTICSSFSVGVLKIEATVSYFTEVQVFELKYRGVSHEVHLIDSSRHVLQFELQAKHMLPEAK